MNPPARARVQVEPETGHVERGGPVVLQPCVTKRNGGSTTLWKLAAGILTGSLPADSVATQAQVDCVRSFSNSPPVTGNDCCARGALRRCERIRARSDPGSGPGYPRVLQEARWRAARGRGWQEVPAGHSRAVVEPTGTAWRERTERRERTGRGAGRRRQKGRRRHGRGVRPRSR